MIITGIDPSFRNSGVVKLDYNPKTKEIKFLAKGTLKPKAKHWIDVVTELGVEFARIIGGSDLVVFEEQIVVGGRARASAQVAKAYGTLGYAIGITKTPYLEIHPSKLRKYFGLKRGKGKIFDNYEIFGKGWDDHQADALGFCALGINHVNGEVI